MNNASISRTPAILIRIAILLLAIAVLAFLLVMPNFEGRNATATFLQVYFNDPFLAYVYVGSIPFFVALYHAFALFGDVTREPAKRLRAIRNCAVTLAAFIAGAEAWIILIVRRTEEDIAGGVAMGIFAMVVAVAIGVAATMFEKRVRADRVVTRPA